MAGVAARPLKPATAAARYRSLRQFFRWLEDDGELDVSPMTKMRPPQGPEQPVPMLTDVQLGALLDACTGKAFTARRDTAIIRTLLDTGGRLSEVARLKVDDVDFNLDVLYVMDKGRRGRSVPFGRRYLSVGAPDWCSIATCAPGAGTTTPTVRLSGSANGGR